MAGMTEPLGSVETSGSVKIGPFLSSNDGKTPLTGLTITQADIQLSKNNGAFAQKNESSSATHDTDGWYDVELNGTDISNTGRLVVMVDVPTALPVWQKFEVTLSGTIVPQVWNQSFRRMTRMTSPKGVTF